MQVKGHNSLAGGGGGPDLDDAAALAGQRRVRSTRLIQLLDHWRYPLTGN